MRLCLSPGHNRTLVVRWAFILSFISPCLLQKSPLVGDCGKQIALTRTTVKSRVPDLVVWSTIISTLASCCDVHDYAKESRFVALRGSLLCNDVYLKKSHLSQWSLQTVRLSLPCYCMFAATLYAHMLSLPC